MKNRFDEKVFDPNKAALQNGSAGNCGRRKLFAGGGYRVMRVEM